MHTIAIHPVNFIQALSTALELTNIGISDHHCRTAIISYKLASQLGLSTHEIETVTFASLLHDVGAAARWEENKQLIHFNQDHFVFRHAEEGWRLLNISKQLAILADPVRYHHDRFDGNNPSGLIGEEIPLASRIIHLADRIEVLLRSEPYTLRQRLEIMNQIRLHAGSYFDPGLVAVFEELAIKDFFWLDLTNSSYRSRFFRNLEFFGKILFQTSDIIGIAEMFATVIDQTSSFTASHSRRVAELSLFLANLRGYGRDESEAIKVAGLLHDLGKLSVSNEILEKPGKLSSEEFEIIKQHPYYTLRILEQIEGFELIAEWAGAHHETIDGKGYPFGLNCEKTRLGARIIAIADIYSALREDRPYRCKLNVDESIDIIRGMVYANKLDVRLVDDLVDHVIAVEELLSKVL
jgi:HD-GYP domain-containing protein (c-di-GMP phosphodiesterase class II)